MTEINHLTAEQIAAMTLDEALAVIAQRRKNYVLWPCTAEEFKAFYALGVRDFSGANLRNADLRDANLRNADLRDADLWNADLWNADLWNADLWNADLRDADLRNADLRNANLWNADLRNANLRGIRAQGVKQLWTISNIGSRHDTLIVWHKDGVLHLHTGCKQDISVQQFRELLAKSSPLVREEYEDALQFLERRLARAMKGSV